MNQNLELEIQRELERLKSIDSTLDFLHKSAKKQMNDYL